MSKSIVVHYRNKYPKGAVHASDSAIDVYDAEGNHCVALRKNGANQMVCQSKEMGCRDSHDLSPIPKDARVHKLYSDGTIGKSEEASAREKIASELAAYGLGGAGKVPSIQELHVHLNPKSDPNSGFTTQTTWESMRPAKKEAAEKTSKK